jgi:hypothetical protein
VLKSEEQAEDLPHDLVNGYFSATPDWVVCKKADGRAKLVVEFKTPQELGRVAMPGSRTDAKSTHVEDCERVSESLRSKKVHNMKPVLKQVFTQMAAHITPYAVVTDGMDFIFLKCGGVASENGEVKNTPDKNNLLRIHFYVARYHHEEKDDVEARPSVAQCLAYVLHRSINDLDRHKWVQERYLEMLKSGEKPKDSERASSPGREDRRCEALRILHGEGCRVVRIHEPWLHVPAGILSSNEAQMAPRTSAPATRAHSFLMDNSRKDLDFLSKD